MLIPAFKGSPECESLFCYPKFHSLGGRSTQAGGSFPLCTDTGGGGGRGMGAAVCVVLWSVSIFLSEKFRVG